MKPTISNHSLGNVVWWDVPEVFRDHYISMDDSTGIRHSMGPRYCSNWSHTNRSGNKGYHWNVCTCCLLYTHQCIAKIQAVPNSGIKTSRSYFQYHHVQC